MSFAAALGEAVAGVTMAVWWYTSVMNEDAQM